MLEIGSTLREARIRLGLDMAHCESETRIRARYLQALEEEHFDSIPAPVYVKSFLRTYAGHLGLDSQMLVDEYASRFEPEPEIEHHEVRQIPPRRRRARLPGGQLVWVALGGVAAVLLLVWVGAGGGGTTAVPLPPTRTVAPPSPVATPPPAPPATPAAPARGVVLAVTGANGTSGSYLEVHRGAITGPMVWVGTVAPGRSRRFRADAALYVRVGWTPGLTARVNGKRAALAGGTANFRVSRRGAERLP